MNVTVEARNEARALVERLRKQAACVHVATEAATDGLQRDLERLLRERQEVLCKAADMIETYVIDARL